MMFWQDYLSENILLTTLLSLPILGLLFYIYCQYKLNYWKRRGVEQLPNAHWLFGHVKDSVLFRSPPGYHFNTLYRAARDDAPFVGFYIFHKPCLLLRDPELIKQIFIRDGSNFTNRHFAGAQEMDSIAMKNLFGLKNPAWKYLRTKITPALTKNKLRQMYPLMIDTLGPMMKFIDEQPEKDGFKIIDAQEMNYRLTGDLISTLALGTKMDSFKDPNSYFNSSMLQFFVGYPRQIALFIVFFIPEVVNWFGTTILLNFKFASDVFWAAIKEREQSGEKRGDFVDSLIQMKNAEQNPLYKFEGVNLFDQTGTFFSGLESGSTTAAFTLTELANHPEYQNRAREEVIRTVAKHGWTLEGFNEMKYINQCLAESIRLHPPLSTIDREAHHDYTIPGTDVVIKKGTGVFLSLYGLHEDPKYFDEPLVFDPERHADGRKVHDAYIPFGIGPRTCAGIKAGELQVKMVVAKVLKDYEVFQKAENVSPLDTRATFSIAANGLVLHFKKLSA